MAVRIRQTGVRRLVENEITQFVATLAGRVESQAKRLSPVWTGRLRTSIDASRPRVRGLTVSATVSTRTGYGLWPERGTGIYGPRGRVIRPRRAPFLIFRPRGLDHVIRTRSVKGQPGQHFMRDALLAVIAAL